MATWVKAPQVSLSTTQTVLPAQHLLEACASKGWLTSFAQLPGGGEPRDAASDDQHIPHLISWLRRLLLALGAAQMV